MGDPLGGVDLELVDEVLDGVQAVGSPLVAGPGGRDTVSRLLRGDEQPDLLHRGLDGGSLSPLSLSQLGGRRHVVDSRGLGRRLKDWEQGRGLKDWEQGRGLKDWE